MFKVCIISCGMITNSAHIPAYRRFADDFRIAAVCDINEAAARDTAQRHGIPNYYTDAEEMLAKERPDVVSVCVPNCLHKKFSMLALSYGCHVLCEKPVAYTYTDAKELYGFAARQGRHLIACQSMRFTPDRLAAKQLIEQGDLGGIYYGEFARIRRRGIPTWGTFHIKEISGGGAFLDIGVHMIDAILWLMGNPKLKSAAATACQRFAGETGSLLSSGALTGEVHVKRAFHPDEMDVEDFASGSLLFENGARMNFTVAWATNMPEASSIRLVGQKSGIDLPQCVKYSGADTDESFAAAPNLYEGEPFFGHFYLFDNLRKVLKGEADLFVKPEETINVARVIETVYRSAELGREVNVKELG